MISQTFCRCGVALFLAALVSGCSMIGLGDTDGGRDSECRWSRSSCMYEGKYEPDERDYAEEEAKRLNQAESRKIRRKSGW